MKWCDEERELKGLGFLQLFLGFLCSNGRRLVIGINEHIGLLPIGLFPRSGSSVSITTSYTLMRVNEIQYQAYWTY